MNKNAIRGCIVLAILAVVFTVVVFALPFEKNSVFALSYIFALIACAVQVYVFYTAYRGGDTTKSKFYGMPIAHVGLVYLAAQMVVSLIFIALATVVPFWLALIVDVVLLGVMAVGFIAADTVRDEVVRQDVQLKKEISAMRAIQASVATLPDMPQDLELSKVLRELADAVRYSDPVSGEETKALEVEIGDNIREIKEALTAGDTEKAKTLAEKAKGLLAERNHLCKLGK